MRGLRTKPMKPTKEQLADPAWWDENTGPEDNYVLWNKERLCPISLEDYINDIDGYELLAKRPEPLSEKWKPKEGEWFTGSGGAQMAFIGIDSGNAYVCEIKGGGLTRLYDFDWCKPIKTQREELIDIINKHDGGTSGLLAKHILARFDLTEKDDE